MQELFIEYAPVVLVAVLGAIARLYYKFLAEKIQSTRIAQMVLTFGQEMRAVINEVNVTYVNALKDAGQDGEWTKEEMEIAKNMAINKLRENWGLTGIKRLAQVLGIGGSIDSWLGTQLEATLSDMKKESLPVVSVVPPKD